MNTTKRRLPLLCLLAVVLLGIASPPAQAGGWSTTVREQAPGVSGLSAGQSARRAEPPLPSAGAGTLVKSGRAPSGQCPPGMVSLRGESGVWCHHRHSAADGFRPVPAGVRTAAPVQPKCYGNGVNGPRVQLLYVYVEGTPNRSNIYVPKILNEWVPAMEGNFRRPSKEQGREIGIRFYAPNCKISVDVLRLDASYADASFSQKTYAILELLSDEGYKGVDRKHLVWADTPAELGNAAAGPCGVAVVGARAAPVAGDNATPANLNNLGNLDQVPGIAIAYRNMTAGVDRSRAGRNNICWGGPIAQTETHELLHTLGAVQTSAPNNDGGLHCSDGNDIMCDPLQAKVRTRCQSRVPMLDCGLDDYFAINPPVGSYLSTHWNTARSRFLGDAIGIDAIPVPLPSP